MKSRREIIVGGILSLILMGAGCSSSPATVPDQNIGVSEPTAAAPTAAVESRVKISGFSFQPGIVTVKVGSTVIWNNEDGVMHTVTADDGLFDSGNLAPGGGTFQYVFSKPGTYNYHCDPHPRMTGTVIVVE